jgi:proline dehydrogenase
MIQAATEIALRAGRDADSFEFQMLYGIRSDEQQRLADAGYKVTVYVPFGTDWWGYFVRRLAERPANLLFFLRAVPEALFSK